MTESAPNYQPDMNSANPHIGARGDCPVVPSPRDAQDSLSLGISLIILLGIWALAIVVVDPRGEFMVNDDWCFVKALQQLFSHGRLESTGWGPSGAPGGPSILIHLLWGHLFAYLGGFSLTILRISVLVAGILGSVALLAVLSAGSPSRKEALWGTVTLVLSPLFLSQCFTFMSDITFAALVSFSLWFLFLAVRTGRTWVLVTALVFALASVLTRQIGVVLPLAFLVVCVLHPLGKTLGRIRMTLLVIGIVVVPWLCYEIFLAWIGSTPVTEHQVIREIWRSMAGKTVLGYVTTLYLRLVHGAMPYTCIFVAPVLALRYQWLWARRSYRWYGAVVTLAFAVVETLLVTGVINPGMQGLRNVIYNAGIGPILLKDVYLMSIPRGPGVSQPEYFLLLYVAVLCMGACVGLAGSALSRLFHAIQPATAPVSEDCGRSDNLPNADMTANFIAYVALVSALLYLGVIVLTGFHDRYLIPVCLFVIVWLVLDRPAGLECRFPSRGVLMGLVPLLFFGTFSVTATADFMALKRAQKQALTFVERDLKLKPCDGDGGMEYNGYHCYDPNFVPRPGLSWWWVVKEDYLVTLGPLKGYDIVRTFPFSRYFGPQAAIHVLRPSSCQTASPK